MKKTATTRTKRPTVRKRVAATPARSRTAKRAPVLPEPSLLERTQQSFRRGVAGFLAGPQSLIRDVRRVVWEIHQGVTNQITTGRSGIANTTDFFGYVFATARAAVKHVFSLPAVGLSYLRGGLKGSVKHSAHSTGDSLGRIKRGASDLLGQTWWDIKHTLNGVLAVPKRLLAPIIQPAAKVLAPLTAPLRRNYATQAKQDVLGEITSTPDHQSHRELLLLAAGSVAVILGVGYLIGIPSGQLTSLPSPGRVLAKLAGSSPEQMAVLFAVWLILALSTWFWVKMLLDSFRRTYETNTEKTKWRTVVGLLFAPGALIYFLKVYNHWSPRRFLAYHFLSIMVTGVAVVVATSTYGALAYFNKKASAQAASIPGYSIPKLDIDDQTKQALLGRPSYGAPLTPNIEGGRVDPFAPIPGEEIALPSPSPSPSASPSAAPAVVPPAGT